MFLVVYSGRGLVIKNTLNLKLFNFLYWVFLFNFTVAGFYFVPNWEKEKDKISKLIILSLDMIIMEFIEKKKKVYVYGQCLNRTTFSSFGGKRRRNIFTGQETKTYLLIVQCSTAAEVIYSMMEPFHFLSQETVQAFLLLYTRHYLILLDTT